MRPFFTAPIGWILVCLLLLQPAVWLTGASNNVANDKEIDEVLNVVLGALGKPNLQIYVQSLQAAYTGQYYKLGSWLDPK